MYNNNNSDMQSNLGWKDQKEFFDKYFPLREEANTALANILITDPPEFNYFFLEFTKFVNWASKGYSTKNTDKDKNHFISEIRKLISEWKEKRNEIERYDEDFDAFYNKCQDLWDEVSEEHMKFELLPRPEIEFYDRTLLDKEIEETKEDNMKLALKAFKDILRNTVIKKERK